MFRILEEASIEGMWAYRSFAFIIEVDNVASVVRDVRECGKYLCGSPNPFNAFWNIYPVNPGLYHGFVIVRICPGKSLFRFP